VLDAAVAAWTAQRIAEGTAVHFGEPGSIEGSDHAFTIWA
jgi:predicted RNase H-like nuclease